MMSGKFPLAGLHHPLSVGSEPYTCQLLSRPSAAASLHGFRDLSDLLLDDGLLALHYLLDDLSLWLETDMLFRAYCASYAVPGLADVFPMSMHI